MSLDLAYAEYGGSGGGGPPVVILHGLLGSARNWQAIAKRLAADGRHVFALDLRNHGASPWAEPMTYPAMAEDVRRFMARHGPDGAAVIGHSMGGKVAMALALAHGGLVGRLIVVDIAPVPYAHGTFLPYVRAMRAVDPSGVTRRGEVEERLRDAVPDQSVRAFLLQNLVGDNGGLRWRVNLAAIEADMGDVMGFPAPEDAGRVYDGPTLFLAGERSDYVRPEHHAAIRRLFPGATIETVPGAGHWVHAEQPQRFIERALAFLGAGGRG
ncbi:MAG TPA: alpha/beta fold hydrolase [Geminicoccaceae bacterium]|nr:alpha/beta fold hydrolase [Geminicoccaceae bacterium]